MFSPSRELVLGKVKRHVFDVLDAPETREELSNYGPSGFDWNDRVREAASIFLPLLVNLAPVLASQSVAPFNFATELNDYLRGNETERVLSSILDRSPQSKEAAVHWIEQCRQLAQGASRAVANVESQQISAEVRRFLLSDDELGSIAVDNGNSIYPDLLLADFDYSFLSFQSRSNPIHGPCLRNRRKPRPSNVPDGCEIKTNQSDKLKVDAHGAHPGLHLGITWGFDGPRVTVYDVWVAYIRESDYTISNGRVDVTTKKRSFGHAPFISLLRGTR